MEEKPVGGGTTYKSHMSASYQVTSGEVISSTLKRGRFELWSWDMSMFHTGSRGVSLGIAGYRFDWVPGDVSYQVPC